MSVSLFDRGPFAPCPAPFNMARHTFEAGRATPDRIALEVARAPGEIVETWTHGALRETVLRAAGGLAARGLTRGDRVLLRLGNVSDFPILFFATNALGAVPVPVSGQLTAREVAGIVADLEPRFACVGAGFEPAEGTAMIGPGEIAALRDAPPADFAGTAPDDPAFVVYTSGTGGRPKGVVLAQRAAWARRMMWEGWYGLTPEDRVLHAGAFNWTFTLGAGLTDPWARGARALLYSGPPDRAVWPALAAAHGATIFAGTPGVYRQMLGAKADLTGFARLRHGLSAGEALPAAVARAWTEATGKPIYEALGMSEISTYISFSPNSPPVPGRAGRPQPGRRVAVLADDGEEPVPRGVPGLLAVSRRDPGLMLGYWRRPEETAAVFRGEWFVTGDRATLHEDDTLEYLGRADDLMNAGGFRVSPAEVEAALLDHPGVAEAAAVAEPARPGVEIIAAYYVPVTDPVPDADLAAHCAARLARYKCPRRFVAVDALPRNAAGKLVRRALRRGETGD
ncbi:class I adenylate-forming enzyme family protein [uncultured Amaricoccus sp.]|uniref:class I adenylate-forming enzyme family protein n=1 Tax=uncultured Amaricoccus sp. TaxID=339341 RepID=UPI0034592A83